MGYKNSYLISSLKKSLLELNVEDVSVECERELREEKVILDHFLPPILQVGYDREYYEDPTGIRITVDQNIQFYGSLPHQKLNTTLPTPYSLNVMEIKFEPHLKNEMANLIKPLNVSPQRNSKYLFGMAMLGYTTYI